MSDLPNKKENWKDIAISWGIALFVMSMVVGSFYGLALFINDHDFKTQYQCECK